MVCRTHRGEEEEEEEGGGAGDEEVLALEQGGRGEGHGGWGRGRVIIFSQEFPHLKSSLGAPSLYICSQLLHHAAAASGPRLCGAIYSASVCVCVCVCVCLWSCECECVCVCVWLWVTVWDRASKACMSKYVRMLAPDYPLSLLITTLCHTSRFYQSPHRTLPSSPLPSFSLFPLRFPSPHPPPPPPSLSSEEQTPVLHQRTRDFNARTNNLPRLLGLSLAAVTPGQACWFDHLFLSVNRACLTLIV